MNGTKTASILPTFLGPSVSGSALMDAIHKGMLRADLNEFPNLGSLALMARRAPRAMLCLVVYRSQIIDQLARPTLFALCTLIQVMIFSRTHGDRRVQSIIAIRLHLAKIWSHVRTLDTQDPSVASLVCRFVSEMAWLDHPCLRKDLLEGGVLNHLRYMIFTGSAASPAACMAIAVLLHKSGLKRCSCDIEFLQSLIPTVNKHEKKRRAYPVALLAAVVIFRTSLPARKLVLQHELSCLASVVPEMLLIITTKPFEFEQAMVSCLPGMNMLSQLAWLMLHESEFVALLSADILVLVLRALQRGYFMAVEEGCVALMWLAARDPRMNSIFKKRQEACRLPSNTNSLNDFLGDASALCFSHSMIPWQRANFGFAVLLFYTCRAGPRLRSTELYTVCKFMAQDSDAGNLRHVISALMFSENSCTDASLCSKSMLTQGAFALVRSGQGDTKIVMPSVDMIPRLDDELHKRLDGTGTLPVLRGNYRIWDTLLANCGSKRSDDVTASDNACPECLLETLKLSRCYLRAIASRPYSSAFKLQSITTSLVASRILAVALKFQIPGLAVRKQITLFLIPKIC
mmetsp:Transcript_24598/g.75854  ORF Transcript_24598/g.75854 Transcript_24598/m.75854 type:complete len:573 (+) Transcript_24598:60-1778(+)